MRTTWQMEQGCPIRFRKVSKQLVIWPLPVRASFSQVGWGALWATRKTRTPVIRKPCGLLARTGNTPLPQPLLPALLVRRTKGESSLAGAHLQVTPQHSSRPGDLVSPHGNHSRFKLLTGRKSENFSFLAERKKEKTLTSAKLLWSGGRPT